MRTVIIDDIGVSVTVEYRFDLLDKLHVKVWDNMAGKYINIYASFRGHRTHKANFIRKVLYQHLLTVGKKVKHLNE